MAKRTLSVEEIAAEVGRLFGTTEAHARRWLDQRKELVKALSAVRERASGLISELGGDNFWPSGNRKRAAKEGIPLIQPGMRDSRKKRVISAATRAKMRAAAKKRWTEIRAKRRPAK